MRSAEGERQERPRSRVPGSQRSKHDPSAFAALKLRLLADSHQQILVDSLRDLSSQSLPSERQQGAHDLLPNTCQTG